MHKLRFDRILVVLLFSLLSPLALADVSGSWTFSVTLGQLGSGDAAITLQQEADGKLSGTYSGQLANGPVAGSYSGNDFQFSFTSEAIGTELTYKGMLQDDGSVTGSVLAQGQSFGTFVGHKKP